MTASKNIEESVNTITTAAAVKDSIWATPPVCDQPSISLVRWGVMETTAGERHLIGYNVDDQEGRASTAVKTFDPATRSGVTASGRRYTLIGPPSYDADADWVWTHWAWANNLQWQDVSEQFLRLIEQADALSSE